MRLTNDEKILLMSLITESIGIESLIEQLGENKVKKIDAIATGYVADTSPNDMASQGRSLIKKLANDILDNNIN